MPLPRTIRISAVGVRLRYPSPVAAAMISANRDHMTPAGPAHPSGPAAASTATTSSGTPGIPATACAPTCRDRVAQPADRARQRSTVGWASGSDLRRAGLPPWVRGRRSDRGPRPPAGVPVVAHAAVGSGGGIRCKRPDGRGVVTLPFPPTSRPVVARWLHAGGIVRLRSGARAPVTRRSPVRQVPDQPAFFDRDGSTDSPEGTAVVRAAPVGHAWLPGVKGRDEGRPSSWSGP